MARITLFQLLDHAAEYSYRVPAKNFPLGSPDSQTGAN